MVSYVKEALAEIRETMATDCWTDRRKIRNILLTASEFVIDNIWEVEPETDTRCDSIEALVGGRTGELTPPEHTPVK